MAWKSETGVLQLLVRNKGEEIINGDFMIICSVSKGLFYGQKWKSWTKQHILKIVNLITEMRVEK